MNPLLEQSCLTLIRSIAIILPSGRKELLFDSIHPFKVTLSLDAFLTPGLMSFDLEIQFTLPISHYRSHDYQWIPAESDWVANPFCPKIIKLSDGTLVQANIVEGIWEVHPKKNQSIVWWRFHPQHANPITRYTKPGNDRILTQASVDFSSLPSLSLLFSRQNAIEFSRSKLPFSAIVCFTDHCDFDTAENLVLQRRFFKENGIKVTKGFFLNHFSKRADNASFEKDAAELALWREDSHELCYHSLTQSLRTPEDSKKEFFSFQPPFPELTTWIDHGYQPYNFSLFEQLPIASAAYEANLKDKHLQILWNYIDSGTATQGVINQLNPRHFTLGSFRRGVKGLGCTASAALMLKNIVFHFYGNPEILRQYRKVAGLFKKVVYQNDFGSFIALFKTGSGLVHQIFKVFLLWPKTKNIPYPLAKYQPVFFKHKLFEKEFYVFQTLEMVDFKKALCADNLDLLVQEKGVFIAHTYFSVPMPYHQGKLFATPTTIDPIVAQNFKALGRKIKEQDIWNPTLQEWMAYWSDFETITFDVDALGAIEVATSANKIFRVVQ
ncbi:hypothetical protein [Flavobacterium sp. TSSA_36]|uniref:hypothetical protein n=1 Tax=Flavobacterium sp. TSSA_36 TaxID=3447669 RepID=UPI003F2B853E